MSKLVLALPALLLASAGAMELTPDNWDAETAGKTVLIKFLAPWWGHCKKLKPDWDRLMKNFNKGEDTLIADVDCTTEGKALCERVGVSGYPTIKWGDPNALEDYDGGRDYKSLKKWVKKNLKPICSPTKLELCSDEQKADIEKYEVLSLEELEAQVAAKQTEIKDAESAFEKELEGLQARYKEMEEEKTKKIAAVKESGLSVMLAVQAKRKKGAKAEEPKSEGAKGEEL